jgi:hypothetical protein
MTFKKLASIVLRCYKHSCSPLDSREKFARCPVLVVFRFDRSETKIRSFRLKSLTGKAGVEPTHVAQTTWPLIRNQAHCHSGTSPLIGGMGSLARLLGPAYRPGFVTVVFGVNAATVSRRKKRSETKRTPFVCHRPLRVCPSLLLQSVVAFFPPRLKHRYAASFRSVYKPSAVTENTLLALTYRLMAAAIKRLSTFLFFLASRSEISAAPRGFPPASCKHSTISAGIPPTRGPLSFRLLLRLFPPLASDSASRSFWRSSSSSFSRTAIASRMTWANTSLMAVAYLLSTRNASVQCNRTLKRPAQPISTMYGCLGSSWTRGILVAA